MNLFNILLRFRFIWLNLLFVGYLWLLQPVALQRLSSSAHDSSPDWLMGGILLGIQAIEMIGLLLKRPVSAYYARRYPDSSQPGGCMESVKVSLFVFAPIFHMCAAALLTIVVLDLLKMTERYESAVLWQCLPVPLFFVVLTKEAFYTVLLLGMGSTGLAPRQARPQSKPQWVERLDRWLASPVVDQITLKDAVKDITGDLLLLIFTTLAYTALWELLTAGALSRQGSERLAEYLGVSILFVVVYFTTRSVYLMQELSIQQSRAARILSWVSFLVTWLVALWSIPTR